MWIGAHPDDEAVAAPLLYEWCRNEEVRCAFLVLTRGNLPSIRSAEAASASQLFGADLILLTLPDGGGVLPPQWPADVDTTVAKLIEAFHPDLVLTFDPRHGTSCHPDHRETGAIVLDAVQRLPYVPDVYLLETRVSYGPIRFAPASPEALRYDATNTWNAVAEDMRRHPSQFDEQAIAEIEGLAADQRAVFIAPASSADAGDAFCP